MMATHRRRALAKGKWMELIDPGALRGHMEHRGIPQARLADYAGCSRQFIYQLLNGRRKSCTPRLAQAIEEVLNAPQGSIFVAKKSIESGLSGRRVSNPRKVAA
ncbi:helix-turn-helix domain-containing protein [Kocuria sp.]|uniref:helix-turn-helix domain-containing protein n=1 Tax=Kocuria sp. TaxID=1871328 RepID=UPI0034CE9633